MEKMDFVDRKRELDILKQFYYAPGADLLVLYGRRRVGKTRQQGFVFCCTISFSAKDISIFLE